MGGDPFAVGEAGLRSRDLTPPGSSVATRPGSAAWADDQRAKCQLKVGLQVQHHFPPAVDQEFERGKPFGMNLVDTSKENGI